MQNELPLKPEELESLSISPFKELGAYEALWSKKGMSFRRLRKWEFLDWRGENS